MAAGFPKDIYVTTYGARPKEQRRKISSAFQSTSKALSTYLQRPIVLSMKPYSSNNVIFTTGDKLIVIFKYKHNFVVYKKSNSTVAILANAIFKQNKPPMMFKGENLRVFLQNVQPTLMYAVANKDFHESGGIAFAQNDVVLILARCRDLFLGITEDLRVGFFPSEVVDIITHPKACFFEGMTLQVTALTNFESNDRRQRSMRCNDNFEITKGRDGLFHWFDSNHLNVPLHVVGENGTELATQMNDDKVYCEVEITMHANKEVFPLYDREITKDTTRALSPPPLPPRISVPSDTSRALPPPPVPPRNSVRPYIPLRLEDTLPDYYGETNPYPCQYVNDTPESVGDVLESKETPCSHDSYQNISDNADETCKSVSEIREDLEETTENEDTMYCLPDCGASATKNILEDIQTHPKQHRPSCDRSDMEYTQILIEQLRPFRGVVLNDKVRETVAEAVDPNVWYDLGHKIKISQNKCNELDEKMENIYDKTYELLGLWYKKFGKDATIGFLLDALVEVNPVDLNLICEDILRIVKEENDGDSPIYFSAPNEDNQYVLTKETRQMKVKDYLSRLTSFHDDEISEEVRHIVSQYIVVEEWRKLGYSLEIPENTLRKIENVRTEIDDKTFDLLGQWHQRLGSEATIGFLLQALESINPVDFCLILKDLFNEMNAACYAEVP